jgi:neutral ceramidase
MTYSPFHAGREIDNSPAAIFNPDGSAKSPITQFNVAFGAGLCGSKSPSLPVDGIPGAKGVPYGSCAEMGAADTFIANVLQLDQPTIPTCEATRTTLSALRLGTVPVLRRTVDGSGMTTDQQSQETLLMVTLPGEPVSMLADLLRSKSPAGADQTFVLGYAQGHIGYILGVEDWLLGGYEPSINIYGPLEGEWLMERSLDLAKLAMTPERDDAEATGPAAPTPGGRFDRYVFPPGKPATIPRTGAAKAGQIPATVPAGLFVRLVSTPPGAAQPDATIPRLIGRASFVFYGGSPEEDTPMVTIEAESAPGSNTWQPVHTRSGRTLGSRGRDVLLTYTPQPIEAQPADVNAHLWAAEWQAAGWERAADRTGVAAVFDAPLGRYRFAVQGTAGGNAYKVQSAPFTLTAEGVVRIAGSRSGSKLTGTAVYPVGHGYRLLRMDAPSDGDVQVAGMATLTVRSLKDNKTETLSAALTAGAWSATTTLDTTSGVEVSFSDGYGNSSQKLSLP